jgi:hypothetical protein
MGLRAVQGGVAAALAACFLLGASAQAASVPVPSAPLPGPATSGSHALYVPGELVVRFRPGTPATERRALNASHGAREQRRLHVPRAFLLTLPGGRDVRAAAAAYERNPNVEFA